MIIISNLYEMCVAQRESERKKAVEEERKIAEEARRQKAEEARQIILATDAPQGIVIPPILIPSHVGYEAKETWVGIPQHAGHSSVHSWANARG